jgi:hypothetical protein
MTNTAAQKLRAIERELKLRKRVYPRWVESGRMSQKQAAEEIAIMEAIAQDYQELVEQERLL